MAAITPDASSVIGDDFPVMVQFERFAWTDTDASGAPDALERIEQRPRLVALMVQFYIAGEQRSDERVQHMGFTLLFDPLEIGNH